MFFSIYLIFVSNSWSKSSITFAISLDDDFEILDFKFLNLIKYS